MALLIMATLALSSCRTCNCPAYSGTGAPAPAGKTAATGEAEMPANGRDHAMLTRFIPLYISVSGMKPYPATDYPGRRGAWPVVCAWDPASGQTGRG